MNRRPLLLALLASPLASLPLAARAHHGWSSFDQGKPLVLAGRATQVAWRNPHAELTLELPPEPKLPADLMSRPVPPQTAAVDGQALLAAAKLPARRDKRWQVELATLTRLAAWQVAEIKPGTELVVLGFTCAGEQGAATLRAEYLWVAGGAYGLRSNPV